jgi:DNA-directed RNA polymerase subunit beta
MTYAAPLFVTAEFTNNTTGEIKSQTVFMGDFPMMTPKGTFVINGTERVVVSQLVRSPGVYFDKQIDKVTDKDTYSCKVIPSRGAWLEFEVDKRDAVGVRIDRKRKQPSRCCSRRSAGTTPDPRALRRLRVDARHAREGPHHRSGRRPDRHLPQAASGRAADPRVRADAAGEPVLQRKRYDLAKVGRYKVNKKLGLELPVDQGVLTEDDVLATIDYVVKLHAGEAATRPTTSTTSATAACAPSASSSRTRSGWAWPAWSASSASG